MQNRRAKVHFRQTESKRRKVKTGVVQGGVLSPALFKGEDRSHTRRSSLPSALQRWRQEWYKEEFSPQRSSKVKTGAVQGGVLSPALFKGDDRSGTRRSYVSSALQRWWQEWYKEEFCLQRSSKVMTGVVQGGVLSPALFKGEDRSGTRRSSLSSTLQRWWQEWYKEEFSLQHSSKVMTGVAQGGVLSPALFKGDDRSGTRRSSPSSAHQLLSGRLSNTASEHQTNHVLRCHCHLHIRTCGDWPNQWPQHITVASAQLHQQLKIDSVNGLICSDTFHARNTRAPHTSRSEIGRPSTNARKEAKCVRSDSRYPSHFDTQHCNNIAIRVQQRNNVLNELSGSTWGCLKETLLTI